MGNPEQLNLSEQVCAQVCVAESLLEQHPNQGRDSQAAIVRMYLIRSIFYGDRVLAAIRDGLDYSVYMDRLEQSEAWSHDALVFLKKGCYCDPQELSRL